MNSQWYPLPENSPLIGMTLEETNLRHLTGVSLMAIQRQSGEEVDYPNSQTALEAKDRLLVVGEPAELAAFNQLAQGEVAIPQGGNACQWLTILPNSPVTGKTLADLNLQQLYDVQVQAIRRGWQFIQSPDGGTDLQAGDRVLLCGNSTYLEKLQNWHGNENGKLSALTIPEFETNGNARSTEL